MWSGRTLESSGSGQPLAPVSSFGSSLKWDAWLHRLMTCTLPRQALLRAAVESLALSELPLVNCGRSCGPKWVPSYVAVSHICIYCAIVWSVCHKFTTQVYWVFAYWMIATWFESKQDIRQKRINCRCKLQNKNSTNVWIRTEMKI